MFSGRVSQASLIKERKWTIALINRFYPDPLQTVPNPYGKKLPLMKIYSISKAIEIELTEDFKQAHAKAMKKGVRQKESSEKRKSYLLHEVSAIQIALPKHDQEELYRLGISNYRELRMHRKEWERLESIPYNNEAFIKSKAVNFLWKKASNYSSNLKRLYRKPGATEADMLLLEKLFNAIKTEYPYLQQQCDDKLSFIIEQRLDELGCHSPTFCAASGDVENHKEMESVFSVNYPMPVEQTGKKDRKGKYLRRQVEIEYEVRHESVVRTLNNILCAHNFKTATKSRHCDMIVFCGGKTTAIFEIKSELDSRSMSEAIGQLIIYSSVLTYQCKLYLVVPIQISERIKNTLYSKGIEVITYKRTNNNIIFEDMSFIVELKNWNVNQLH